MYQPKEPITSAAEIKAIVGPILPNQIAKVIDHIDAHCKAWIERSPFIVVSSINAAGAMDISPKGDTSGMRISDEHTLRRKFRRPETTARIRVRPRPCKLGLEEIAVRSGAGSLYARSGTASLARDPEPLCRDGVNEKVAEVAK